MNDPFSSPHDEDPKPADPFPQGEIPGYRLSIPSIPIATTSSVQTLKPNRTAPLVLTGLLLAGALASLTFVLGRMSVTSVESAVPVFVETTVATLLDASPSTVVESEEPASGLLEIPDSAEPVAAIAAHVAPAVVQIETLTGVGSGVIYDASGLILTAAHVVDTASEVTVRLFDGRTVAGTVVGLHAETDVAVVRIVGETNLPTAELAVGIDPRVGSLAVALGSPFGLDQTVTAGVVSAVRTIGGVGMVQTDAAINPGNSGGPLVDRLGRVIGINDQIFTQSGSNEGVGFAISIDIAVLVADQLTAGQEVQLARLGVSSTTLTDGAAGALVQEVDAGSAAAAADLQVGDLIVAIDERVIRNSGDLRAEIISTAPGTVVDLTVLRDGVEIMLQATLGSASF